MHVRERVVLFATEIRGQLSPSEFENAARHDSSIYQGYTVSRENEATRAGLSRLTPAPWSCRRERHAMLRRPGYACPAPALGTRNRWRDSPPGPSPASPPVRVGRRAHARTVSAE